MRILIGYAPLVASLVALIGVGERLLAALLMTWKFGFRGHEPIHLIPQSFWLFIAVFAALIFCTVLLLSFAGRIGFKAAQLRAIRGALILQSCTCGFLLVMFTAGIAVLT
jgi:hypothetical protein